MKIALKNVTVHPRMSEETVSFAGDVTVDGKVVGTATNRGRGGPIMYHFPDPELGKAVHAYAATVETKYNFEQLDMLLDPFVQEAAHKQWVKDNTRRRVLMRLEGEPKTQFRIFPLKKGFNRKAVIDAVRAKYGSDIAEIY